MRQFMTSTVEQRTDFSGTFSTHPIETAWASEALIFITVEEPVKSDKAVLNSKVQLSVDGVNWVDEGTVFEPINNKGQYFVKVTHFGGWLRLLGSIKDQSAIFNLTIHVVLKE